MSQIVDFSQINTINHNGIDISKLVLNGTRLWERYEIDEVYQEWVESGYTQEDAIVPSSVWLFKTNENDWIVHHSIGFSYVAYKRLNYFGTPYVLNGKFYLNIGNSGIIERGSLQLTGTYYRYEVRSVQIADKWIDTSANVEKTRKKTMYYY